MRDFDKAQRSWLKNLLCSLAQKSREHSLILQVSLITPHKRARKIKKTFFGTDRAIFGLFGFVHEREEKNHPSIPTTVDEEQEKEVMTGKWLCHLSPIPN